MISSAEQEVRQILQNINDAWLSGRPEDLVHWFHADMVIVSPDFQQRFEGREACVKSYADFYNHATVHALTTLDPEIDVFGNTAVAAYQFEITYEMSDETHRDNGWDVFVFARDKDNWQAVWRTVLPLAQDE
jgi:ketosteroid isomerase-like protein